MGRGQGPIPNDFPHTLAAELTKAGYRTHLVGKGHFHPQRAAMGFETMELDESGRMPDSDHRLWFAENAPDGVTPDDHGVDWNSWHARPWHTEEHLHPTCWTMTRALEFLNRHDHERPFFLNISFARPHSPYVPPAHYFDMYYRGSLPEPHVGEWAAMHDDPETAKDPNAWRGKMTGQRVLGIMAKQDVILHDIHGNGVGQVIGQPGAMVPAGDPSPARRRQTQRIALHGHLEDRSARRQESTTSFGPRRG